MTKIKSVIIFLVGLFIGLETALVIGESYVIKTMSDVFLETRRPLRHNVSYREYYGNRRA